jgi:hypothetical protein
VTRNEAIRAQVKVMMADGAGAGEPAGAGESDELVDAVLGLVLETMGIEAPAVGLETSTLGSQHGGRSPRELTARQAAAVVERIEPLTAVVDAADRYRKAVGKGKREKKARKRLFEALEVWKESRTTPTARTPMTVDDAT